MGPKLSNNAASTLAGSITALSTSLVVATGDGAKYPLIEAGEWFPLTLTKIVGAEVFREIVHCTARNLDVFTVVRGAENTTALTFSAGDKVELRATAGVFAEKASSADVAGKASLAGGNSFTGVQKFEAQRFKFLPLGNVSGALSINLALAGTYSFTATGPTVVSFTGTPPTGEDQQVYLKIANGGGRVTFQPGTMASKGVAPVLSAAGRDNVAVWYDPELAANVVGLAFQDYKAIP